jgi:uncharacterized damage-inducible protein DinB
MTQSQLIDAWEIHNRINIYLLDAIDPGHLTDLSASKGRTVGEQFAHIHNVRLMWLKSAAPELLDRVQKIEKENAGDKRLLEESLIESGKVMSELLNRAEAAGGKLKGFKPHSGAFLGYLISHESHHRGQITLSLKQAGHPIDKKTQFGLWEWGVR